MEEQDDYDDGAGGDVGNCDDECGRGGGGAVMVVLVVDVVVARGWRLRSGWW